MLFLSLFSTKFKAENALSTLAVATGSNDTNFKSADSAPGAGHHRTPRARANPS